jgi:hypothetical protein
MSHTSNGRKPDSVAKIIQQIDQLQAEDYRRLMDVLRAEGWKNGYAVTSESDWRQWKKKIGDDLFKILTQSLSEVLADHLKEHTQLLLKLSEFWDPVEAERVALLCQIHAEMPATGRPGWESIWKRWKAVEPRVLEWYPKPDNLKADYHRRKSKLG